MPFHNALKFSKPLSSLVLMMGILSQLIAQDDTFVITGKVLDAEDDTSLPGASVVIEGTTVGTTTDFDGNFTLEVPSNAVLLVSFIGYESQEVRISSGQSFVEVKLPISISQLEEIVVIGYGTQKRSAISGAVSVTTADEINKLPAPRLEQVLQGRTSGVQITQSSGSPGNALSVRVRGIGTPNNSDPLYVVDGVWFDDVSFLNPADIESISVLKDAASAAIYGTNGANGVILITTRSGKSGQKGQFTYESYTGIQTLAKTYEVLNAQQYAELMLEANGGLFNDSDVRSILNDPSSLGSGTDWQGALFENAPISSHQLSVQGGGESATYSLMGSYFTQEGIVGGEKSGYDRYTLRAKTTQNVNKALTVGQNISFTYLERSGLAENNEFASPIAFAQNIDPVTSITKDDGTYNFSTLVVGDIKNPLNRIDKFYNTFSSNQVVGNVFAELEPIEGLKFKTSASLDINFAETFDFAKSYNLDPTNAYVHEQNQINGLGKTRQKWTNLMWENIVSYSRSFDDHNFSWLGGTTYRDRNYELLGVGLGDLPFNTPDSAYIYGLTLDNPADSLGNHERLNAYEGLTESTLFSFFTKLDYNFKDRYFLTATVRRDGSSRFGANNRYATFPSVSFGWLISEESIGLPSFVNFAKLRASWGQNGNEKIDDYGFVGTINNGAGEPAIRYVFGSGGTIYQGAAPTTPANPDRKWEVTTQTNIGLDLAFLNDKIQFTTDYFYKLSSDILIRKEEPAIIGTGVNYIEVPYVNAGEILNHGFEFLAIYNYTRSDFTMDISLNATLIKNKVLDLGVISTPISSGYNQGVGGSITRMEEGLPFGYFYGYRVLGVFQNKFEVEEHTNDEGKIIQPRAEPGDFKFADLDGDGQITSDDREMIGNPYPDAILGFTGNFSYKVFDLSLFVQSFIGNDIFNATTRWDLGVQNRPIYRLDRWTEDNPSDTEPRAVINDTNGNFRVSDYFVEDGSFLRIKNIQFGITVPENLSKKVFVQRFRWYFNVQNLLTLTKYRGLDPEVGKSDGFSNDQSANLDFGIDRGYYPQARTFTTGFNITF
jgi:TonB-linked SusC/RagA family outer membrane protein